MSSWCSCVPCSPNYSTDTKKKMCNSGNWRIKYEKQRKSPDDSYVKGPDGKQNQKKFIRQPLEKKSS